MDEFYRVYAADVVAGEANYVVEQRTKVFPFLVDLDVFGREQVGAERVRNYVSVIIAVMKEFYPIVPPAYVFTRPATSAVKDGENGIKSGIHIIFPGLNVTNAEAMMLRDAVIIKGGGEDGADWEDVMDASVYKGNGLRMPGSRKMEPCGCVDGCLSCGGRGRIDVGRVYTPYCVVATGGDHLDDDELQSIRGDAFEMVRKTAVRTAAGTLAGDFRIPEWFPEEGFNGKQRQTLKRKVSALRAQVADAGDGDGKYGECRDAELFVAVSNFIQRAFPHAPVVTKLSIPSEHSANPDFYLARSSSRFCQNKGGVHKTSNVYFHINRRGISQKCYCQCDEKRSGGICRKYRSPVVCLSAQLKKKLFVKKQGAQGGTDDDDDGNVWLKTRKLGKEPFTLEQQEAELSFIRSL